MPGARPNRNRETHLTNRSAWLSLTAALFFFVGLVTFGVTVQKSDSIAIRALSGAPLGVAIGSAVWAGVTRGKLRALRQDVEDSGRVTGGPAVPDSDGSLPLDERPPGA